MPIVFRLSKVDAATGSAIPRAVVYLWHCTPVMTASPVGHQGDCGTHPVHP